MMRTTVIAALLLTLAPPASADEGVTHDGLFFRVGMGPRYGFGVGSGHDDGRLLTHGYAVGFDVEIGQVHFKNLALHGDFTFVRLVGRKLSATRTGDLAVDSFTNNLKYTLFSMGMGATYYFMPQNIYATLGVGFGRLAVVDDAQQSRREDIAVGVAVNTMVGREWRFGDDLAIGIGGQFTWSITADRAARWNLMSLGLVATVAYN